MTAYELIIGTIRLAQSLNLATGQDKRYAKFYPSIRAAVVTID